MSFQGRFVSSALLSAAVGLVSALALGGCGADSKPAGPGVQYSEVEKAQIKSEAEETQAAVKARHAARRGGK